MTAQTLEQKRAKHALDQIKSLERQGKPGKYMSYVNALPAAILMNGLGQALATERAASDKAHTKLANHVAAWLLSEDAHTRYGTPTKEEAEKEDDFAPAAQPDGRGRPGRLCVGAGGSDRLCDLAEDIR